MPISTGVGNLASAIHWQVPQTAGKPFFDELLSQWLGGLSYAKSQWVAAGGYGRRTHSADGVTWTDIAGDGITNAFRSSTYDPVNQRWVAVGEAKIWSQPTAAIEAEAALGEGRGAALEQAPRGPAVQWSFAPAPGGLLIAGRF